MRQNLGPTTGRALLLVAVIVLIVPSIAFLVFASFGGTGAGSGGFGDLHGWRELLTGDGAQALVNTIVIAAVTTIVATPLAFGLAFLDAQTDAPLRRTVGTVLIMPMVFSPLITAVAWTILASPRAGLVNIFFRDAFGVDVFFDVYSMAGMILIGVLYFVPLAFVVMRSSLLVMDGSVWEAARMSGAGVRGAVWRVLLPLARPAIGSAALLVFTGSVGVFAISALIGPTAQVNTLQLDAYHGVFGLPVNTPRAAAGGVVLLLLAVGPAVVYRQLIRNPARYATLGGRGWRPIRIRLGAWRVPAFLLVLGYLIVSVVLPYLALLYAALVPYLTTSFTPDLVGTQNFQAFFSRSDMTAGLTNTLILAIAGSAGILVLAVLVSAATKRVSRIGRFTRAVSDLPLGIPGMSFALGLLWFVLAVPVLRDNLYGTLIIIWLAQAALFLPSTVQIVNGGMLRLGSEVLEAAQVAGAPVTARVARVILPLLRPALVSSMLVLFLHSAVESGMTIFLYTGSTTTLAVNVYNSVLTMDSSLGYAGSFAIATLGIVAVIVGNRTFRGSAFLQQNVGR